ncbi:phenylalanine--tRNA ligase subunit beta [Uliginosibacterium sp. sgz301328]|uniref:phenylalanine--tRNA ligase subunit beta n=1 Tax=Uliginosibacterium sp. sgz301328 TaxID=3243764 RepID=UPI00359DBF6A
MQFSEQWLRSLVNPALDSDALCHLLTMAGLEVEEVSPVAPDFSGVVVAQIVSFEKHPNADKLKVCAVDIGTGELQQIVCGAPNVFAGMKAPCARVGAKLPGFDIKAAKLRGVESFGMMCSSRELGLDEDHGGLMVLPEDAPVGTDVRQYLSLDDKLITIKLTPNRADCLSLMGVAREVSALTATPLQAPQIKAVPAALEARREVVLNAPKAGPRYLGRVLRDVNTQAPTPAWMRQRLERCGVRSISAVVDVTNYVMLELGQPLHAFDDDTLKGAIHVRHPAAGEQITLLNGQVVDLLPDHLLIADESRPLALAGVMGGEASGVGDNTRNVFLESAFFQPDAIAGRARALGFSSDASHRFERGVDPELAPVAMERATALILEICGGQAGAVVEAISTADMPVRARVTLGADRARKVIGVDIPTAEMAAIFERLGMRTEVAGERITVQAPSYRFDIEIEEDLIEEVARVFGYDNIPPVPPMGPMRMLPQSEGATPAHRLRRRVAARDYQEIVSFAFVEEAWERDFAGNADPIRLANPIASQLAVMRSSLIGGLIGVLDTNIRRRASRVRLFEIGRCFSRDAQGVPVEGYAQPLRLAGLAWGPAVAEQWGTATRRVDFFDVKADVEALLGDRASYVAATHPALHPGRCAAVVVDGKQIGVVGELHPAWVQKYDLSTAPVVFELDLSRALEASVPAARDLTRQPSVTRDLALVVPVKLPAGELVEALRAAAPEIVRSVAVFDVYTGKGIDPEHKSIALRAVLQHTERTLEETEIEQAMNALVQAAEQKFGAHLRA